MPIKYKYTPEMLAAAAAISLSIADVLRHLGITLAGGNYTHISRQLKRFGIDTSHFLGQAHHRGQRSARRLSPGQVLRVRPPGSPRTKPPTLRRALREAGVPYRCGGCKIEDTWEGGPLTLHVDHINGDWLDNRINNLRFLCPNCHSQTENFAGKNRGRSPTVEAHDLGSCQSGFESRRPHKRPKNYAIGLKSLSANVTLSVQDVFFIEYYLDQKRAKSRSAVVRKAIQLLRESTLEEDYAAAFGEMGEREEAEPPGSTVKDGIGDPV